MSAKSKLLEFPPLGEKPAPVKAKRLAAAASSAQINIPLPEAAMYGVLGTIAKSLEGPLAWCYCALLAIWAGMNGTCVHDDNINDVRPTLYIGMLGPAGEGKSVASDRAKQALNPNPENVEEDTPASDKGVYRMFGIDPELPPYLRTCVLVLDEMRDFLSKMMIAGSSLAPVICKLFNKDRAGSADAKAHNRVFVRLSILGNIATQDVADFETIFGEETSHGLYTRFIFAPPPEKTFRWRRPWRPTVTPPKQSKLKVKVLQEDYDAFARWEMEYEALGYKPTRLAEIGLRIAVLTACANNETSISAACLASTLEFISWQAQVKFGYTPGEAKNEEAECSAAIIRAMKEHGLDSDGRPVRLHIYKLVKQKNWNRKYGAGMVVRMRRALAEIGTIVMEYELEGEGDFKKRIETGYFSLNPGEFESGDK